MHTETCRHDFAREKGQSKTRSLSIGWALPVITAARQCLRSMDFLLVYIFQSCYLVRQNPVRHFPVLHFQRPRQNVQKSLTNYYDVDFYACSAGEHSGGILER